MVGAFDASDDLGAALMPGRPGNWWSKTFFWRRAKDDPMAALSPAEATWPLEPII